MKPKTILDYFETRQQLKRKRIIKLRMLSDLKLIKFVTTNPGLTSNMIALCLRRKVGTVSSMMSKICQGGKLKSKCSTGMRGTVTQANRYYPL